MGHCWHTVDHCCNKCDPPLSYFPLLALIWNRDSRSTRGKMRTTQPPPSFNQKPKKVLPHQRSFEMSKQEHCCPCCAQAPADTIAAPLHANLLAPKLACSLAIPRAHCRQQPIKRSGLYHVHDLQFKKATSRRCELATTLHFMCRPSPCTKLGMQPGYIKGTLETATYQKQWPVSRAQLAIQ